MRASCGSARAGWEKVLKAASVSIFILLASAAIYAQLKPTNALATVEEKADQGDAAAQTQMGLRALTARTPNYTNALKWFRLAAEQGFPMAAHNMGGLYFRGNGVPQNFKESIKWYQRAADTGFAPSQSFLGWMYATGKGVEENPQEAIKWYLKAADQGDKEAQYSLGLLYMAGEPNYIEAYKWINLSAAQGNTNAIRSRAKLAVSMTSEQIEEAQKRSSEFVPKPADTANKEPANKQP